MASADLRQELNCSICLSIYTDPVTLRCGHNFCRKCIVRVLDAQERAGAYRCPECRAECQERPALRRNITLCNVVEILTSAQQGQEKTGILCTYCVDFPAPAAKSCLLCEAHLCDRHLRVHSNSPQHVLCDPTAALGTRKCSVHNIVLEYYCTEDAVCICLLCMMGGEHRGHKVENLEETYKKEKLRDVLLKLSTKSAESEKKVQSMEDRSREDQGKAAGAGGTGLHPKAADTRAPKPAFSSQGKPSNARSPSIAFRNVSPARTPTSAFGSAIQSSRTSGGFGSAAPVYAPAPSSNTPPSPASAPAPSSTIFSGSASPSAPNGSSTVFGRETSLSSPSGSSLAFAISSASSTPTSSRNVCSTLAPVRSSSSGNLFGSGAPTGTSASSNGLFCGSSAPTNSTTGPVGFGQPTTAGSSCSNAHGSKNIFVFSGQENKATITSAGAATATATLFGFGESAPSATPKPPSFNFTATNTSSVTGTNSTPFIFGAGAVTPTVTSVGTATATATLFGFGPPAPSATPAPPSFNFTTVNTSDVAGTNSTPFSFGAGAAAPVFATVSPIPAFGKSASPIPAFGKSASPIPAFGKSASPIPAFGKSASPIPAFGKSASLLPAFGKSTSPIPAFGKSASPLPTFGKSASPLPAFGKSASQTDAPTFGFSASPSLHPVIIQTTPTFGKLTNNVQNPPVFGQPSTQPALGSNTAPSGGSGFQFGNQNFDSENRPSVSMSGPNSGAAQAQPANTGFVFNQNPTYTLQKTGRIPNRKIKNARRSKNM